MAHPAKVTRGSLLVAAFFEGAVLSILALAVLVPLDIIAAPTLLCEGEIAVVAAIFLIYLLVRRQAEDALDKSNSSILRLLRSKVDVPTPLRAVALVLFVFGSFGFAFWAIADVVGGYNGYNFVFFFYPIFHSIYGYTIGLIPYVTTLDKGTQACLFIGLAMLGIVLFRLDRGIGAAFKDAVTLFFAPCLVVFELALWSRAPEDMSWHVTDFLWIGGTPDGGIRQRDFVLLPFHNYPAVPGGHFVGAYASGPYVFSNWLVLTVALVLVASRIPWMSLRQARHGGGSARGPTNVELGAPAASHAGLSKRRGPAGRTISAWGAFEPTTLRFLWPEQAGRVGQGRPLQPEAYGSLSGSARLSYRGTERGNRRGGYNLFEDARPTSSPPCLPSQAAKRLRNESRKCARPRWIQSTSYSPSCLRWSASPG